MGLTSINIFEGMPKIDMTTKEWEDECNQLWDILEKYGSVCITDLSKSGTCDIVEELKKNPDALAEYDCDISFDKFYARLMAGEYDRK